MLSEFSYVLEKSFIHESIQCTYLDAVPKAVIRTGLRRATTLNGSVLVQTKYITVSVPNPCRTKPSTTVAKYNPNLPMSSAKLAISTTLATTRKKIPRGDILKYKRHVLSEEL